MSPSTLYSGTLSVLTAARSKMLSPEWQVSIDSASPDQRLAASRELIQVQQAILALSNESLGDIASEMQDNGADLSAGISALQSAFTDITKVQDFIGAVSGVLSVVAKIVPLL